MMPAALIYALSTDEQREAEKRAEARHRLVRLLTQEPVHEERTGRRRLRLPLWLVGARSTARTETGGVPCRP